MPVKSLKERVYSLPRRKLTLCGTELKLSLPQNVGGLIRMQIRNTPNFRTFPNQSMVQGLIYCERMSHLRVCRLFITQAVLTVLYQTRYISSIDYMDMKRAYICIYGNQRTFMYQHNRNIQPF